MGWDYSYYLVYFIELLLFFFFLVVVGKKFYDIKKGLMTYTYKNKYKIKSILHFHYIPQFIFLSFQLN